MKKQHGIIAAAVALALSAPVYAADITISGVVEVDASVVNDKIGYARDNTVAENTTDIVLATAALAVDAKVNERVSAHLAFLYEEDATDFGLDEGTLSLQLNTTTALTAGRMFVPFGSFESNMISDPLTLVLGETSETAIMLDMASGNFFGSLYTFNGDAEETSTSTDNDTLSFGANLGFANDNLSLGASYISNLADTDFLQATTPGTLKSAVAGYGVNLSWSMNNFSVIAEYLAAAENFTNGDVLTADDIPVANQEQPTASNIELAYDTGSATIAVGYQMSEEAAFLGLPETVTSAAVSFAVLEGASVGIEYAAMTDYELVDGGTGETSTAFTVQLAVEF